MTVSELILRILDITLENDNNNPKNSLTASSTDLSKIKAAADAIDNMSQALIKNKSRPPKLGHDLSPREREVLTLVVEGLSNEEIAERLVISVNTVRKHVSACMSKLEAANRAQVAAQAVRHQIVS